MIHLYDSKQVGNKSNSRCLLSMLEVDSLKHSYLSMKTFDSCDLAWNAESPNHMNCPKFVGTDFVPGNTKERSITVLLTSCLTGLD